ncbi:Na+/H+ antiporter NhaC family protein [Clostridium sp. MSJ-8]|nr:Na+/H+ antiporter NhaC family protein [Clostridium sp. MSJ-8]MBU5489000.1 Na+/H+ antiporter NhaC family protein [Clostridium sp. MSJ-8]
MKQRGTRILILVIGLLIIASTPVLAVEVTDSVTNADKFGILTLIPPLVSVVLAFITKNVVISLFIGVLSGCFMLQILEYNVFLAILESFLKLVSLILDSLADPWNAGIILQVLVIGGIINLVSRMGGAKAVAEALARKAKGARSTQIVTWLLGICVFFDDYANALIVGPIMKPVADKMKVSREKLAFVIDATAAPIAGIAIISTWIGLEVGLINDGYAKIGLEADAFSVFLNTIPYRFYNILILIFVVLTAITLREFGPMRKAELRARRGEQLLEDIKFSKEQIEETSVKEGVKLSVWNAIIPIGTLIISALISFYYSGYSSIMSSDDILLQQLIKQSPLSFTAIRECFGVANASSSLFQAALFSSIVTIILGVCKKIFTISEAIDTWIDGMKGLLITGVILLLAWSLGSVIKEVGTADYLITLLSSSLPKFILPSVIFIFGAVISFSTGTAYGTMSILMPLAIPLAYAIYPDNTYVVMSTSAVLTGAIFGDHCSPISDTTILSSMGAGCSHIDHVKTQMWYSLFVGLVTILFGYIPVGLGVPIYVALPMAIIVLIALTYFLGKPIEDEV